MTLKTNLFRFIDKYLFSIICLLIYPFIFLKPKARKIEKVLFIKLWAIGESILTLPTIIEFKKKYPNAKIDVLVKSSNKFVFEGQKAINNVYYFNFKFFIKHIFSYDLAFDLEPYANISAILAFFLARKQVGFSHGIRSFLYDIKIKYNDKQHVVYTYIDMLKPFNIFIKPKKLIQLYYPKESIEKINNLLKQLGVKNKDMIIGIHAGVGASSKCRAWQKDKFVKLIEKIITRYKAKIFLTGSKHDQEVNKYIISKIKEKYKKNLFDLTNKFSLQDLFYFVKKCKVFISNDTGPMHIAAAQDVKTIGLFGPNTPVRFAPFGKKNISIYKPLYPEPCINVHKGQVPECKHAHMTKITINDVFKAVEKLLKN